MSEGATDQVQRLLAVIPWVMAYGPATVEDVCARFHCSPEQLQEDLDLAMMTGVAPYSPDRLIEAVIDGDEVSIRADWFHRPLRLTPGEGLALVASAQGLLAAPGTDKQGPLATGLAKLAVVLGLEPDRELGIDLGAADSAVLSALRRASATHKVVGFRYYSHGRDAEEEREVEPWQVFSSEGEWYLVGWDRRRCEERTFRVDRVVAGSERVTAEEFDPPAKVATSVYRPRPDDPQVVIRLQPEARWVAEQYPTLAVEPRQDGSVDVRMTVSSPAWLARLLVRLGPEAELVEAPPNLTPTGRNAARAMLARYRRKTNPPNAPTINNTYSPQIGL